MKIWTGKICLLLAFVAINVGCSSNETRPVSKEEVPDEVSLKDDRQAIEELRKDIPAEKKTINDRLSEMLNRWKTNKMEPEDLREHFDDELRKVRAKKEQDWKRRRDDFQRKIDDERKAFQDKQKSERDDFLSGKPTSQKRSDFSSRQSTERERFYDDQRDTRDEFNEELKDERKEFEQFNGDRRSEFRDEYPEYSRIYNEMKKVEEEKKEKEKENPKPYTGWPYKLPGDAAETGGASGQGGVQGAPSVKDGSSDDVNKGGNGWPSSDPSEFDQLHSSHKNGP